MNEEQCRMCGALPVTTRPYSGEVLCENCFRDSVISNVRRAISKYQMLQRTDRIAVAYSSGKDSTVLLAILVEIQKRFPESEVIAITLEEGSKQDKDRHNLLQTVTKEIGIEHVTSSFQEIFSLTLDEVADRAQAMQSPLSPCAYCGTLRRQGLNILARKIQADKLALGHNLDDEVQSMLMNLIRGDLPRLSRITPFLKGVPNWLVPRIKPLYHLLESDIALFAELLGYPIYHPPCPYKETSLRSEMREWLNTFEEKHPGSKFNLHATLMKIIEAIRSPEDDPFQKCVRCGEITSKQVCAVCLHKDQLGLSKTKKRSK
ncbi:MAG: TIGR00269 family protein [Promethearchaeota archaeon]